MLKELILKDILPVILLWSFFGLLVALANLLWG